ncbi:methionyl-tRNA formyltransferase [Lutibacter sp. B2]|nr:methionyl-tRNA formyltransferase [Lutibacter sp. B2]
MKIVFMGTPEFAVPCLNEIIDKHEVLAVVTQPDRPKGRGKKLSAPPVKEKALFHDIIVLQPLKVRDEKFIEEMKVLNPDYIVVVAFGQILPKELLDIPKFGCINVHASLLPQYRGAAPINWCIINGESITGVTTMYMNEGLDTGDMILKSEILIEDKTADQLHDELSAEGAKLLDETLNLIEMGRAPREKQIDSQSSYAPIMNKNLGNINWQKSAESIRNLIRGVIPWPSAYTTYKGEKFKVWKAEVQLKIDNDTPGKIIEVNNQGVFVCTGDGILVIKEVQFLNSRRMTVDAYLRGHEIEEGAILGE